MPRINETERKIQQHVMDLFKDKSWLGYTSYGNLKEEENTNIRQHDLLLWLQKRGYSQLLAERAVEKLVKTAGNLQQGLCKANQDVYSLLKYGAKVHENPGEPDTTVYFIDWEHSHNNDFAIAEEVTLHIGSSRRPDLVVYVNGIALAVIELKNLQYLYLMAFVKTYPTRANILANLFLHHSIRYGGKH